MGLSLPTFLWSEPILLAADFLSKSATRVKSGDGFSYYHYDVVYAALLCIYDVYYTICFFSKTEFHPLRFTLAILQLLTRHAM